MRLMMPLVAVALLAAPIHAAVPKSTVAAAVADTSRQADNRKLDEGRHPAEVLAFAQVKPGSTVVDFMAGGGYYTEMLSRLVGPKGSVLPMNPAGFHKAEVWDAIQKSHANVTPLIAPVNNMSLAPRSVDLIFTHLVYHDLYWESEKFNFARVDVDAMVANWFRALRPGGTVVIVDHVGPGGDTRALVDKLHRIDPAKVRADMERAGFVLDGEADSLRMKDDDHSKNVFDPAIRGKTDRFMMRFRKPA
ncbi:MAG: class I SAM-dependent methyltransferase [Sphingomonadales bacterium]|nr:class I SAM-dependent methyltransferase [Sphingomonadales bacterium]